MKKYTIKDSLGNKKVIYAENIDHAIRLLNDSKITDAFNLKPGDVYLTRNTEDVVYKVLKIDNASKNSKAINVTVEAYQYDEFSGKIERQSGAFNKSLYKNDIKTVFSSMNEAIKYLQRLAKLCGSLLNDSINDAIDIEHYANYCWTIQDGQLIRDLIDEGLDEGLSFNDVVRNHDKATSSILAKVKSYIDKSKKDLLSYENYYESKLNKYKAGK